jgi:hypothetical protein
LTQNPILKVLSTFRNCAVRSLLMGGQACILYGAAEFSRDTDFAVLHSEENLERLRSALRELAASPIFVPPLAAEYLARGHACHFRCGHPDAEGFRVDVMAVLRGCDPFDALWDRREVIDLPEAPGVAVLSLCDLVSAKKTQSDKDWPMVRRLVEIDYERHKANATEDRVRFWLRESRTPAHLLELAAVAPNAVEATLPHRPLLKWARNDAVRMLEQALVAEQELERERDRAYWAPLRAELEGWRHSRGECS